jgi:hypothetical protein
VLVRHLTKVALGRAVHRGLGSVGLVGTCRSAWLVAEDAEVSSRRVLAQVKNNLGPAQPSLAFEVTRPAGGAAVLSWLGPVAVTADALMAPPRRRGRAPDRRDAACEALERILADGPLQSGDVLMRTQEAGMSVRTMERAKKVLGVRSEWAKCEGRQVTYWLLPDQSLPAEGE